jgi:hypothetical protein
MGVEPKKTNKPIAKLLHAAGLDLDAATRLLAEPPNVLAANHLQQAAEKILAAVRLHRGLLKAPALRRGPGQDEMDPRRELRGATVVRAEVGGEQEGRRAGVSCTRALRGSRRRDVRAEVRVGRGDDDTGATTTTAAGTTVSAIADTDRACAPIAPRSGDLGRRASTTIAVERVADKIASCCGSGRRRIRTVAAVAGPLLPAAFTTAATACQEQVCHGHCRCIETDHAAGSAAAATR